MEYKLCDKHYLLFYLRLQLVKNQLAILVIQIKSVWDARSDLLQYVHNNKEWFWKNLLFVINIVLSWHDAIGPDLKQREVSVSPSVISAQSEGLKFEEPVKMLNKKRTLLV